MSEHHHHEHSHGHSDCKSNHEHSHKHSDCEHTHEHHHEHEHSCCGHHHDHPHVGGMHVHPVTKNLWLALILNSSFTIIEFIGGLFTNSMAILSDAVHDLGDTFAIAIALFLEKKSESGRTKNFTYGKKRLSILGAFITSAILLVGAIYILIHSIPRFLEPEVVKVNGVLWLSVLGLFFNGLAVLRLRKGASKSLNQRAVMLHLMEDVLGWMAVLVGGVIMYFTQWYWIDPLLSIGIAFYILYNASKNLWDATNIFLQTAPHNIDTQKIESELLKIEHIQSVHDIHIWTMDGEMVIFSAHLVVNNKQESLCLEDIAHIKKEALHLLQHYHIQHPTLQIDFSTEERCILEDC